MAASKHMRQMNATLDYTKDVCQERQTANLKTAVFGPPLTSILRRLLFVRNCSMTSSHVNYIRSRDVSPPLLKKTRNSLHSTTTQYWLRMNRQYQTNVYALIVFVT